MTDISTHNTVLPRHIAAILDNVIAMILGVVAAKSVAEDQYALQSAMFVAGYLSYYFIFEAAIARTPGKLLTGLVIVRTDGSRATVRDAAIRTAFRVLEVNPACLGAIPAAVCILRSKHHQRFGDKAAGTIVVPPDRVPKS